MTLLKNITFGLPSIPRQTMPSMYQILSWNDEIKNIPIIPISNQNHKQKSKTLGNQNIIQNVSQVKSQHTYQPQKKISKSQTKHYQLYQYKTSRIKAHSQTQLQSNKSKTQANITTKKIHQPSPQKLDPNNIKDQIQIQARKKRIKSFQYVTRDLPNSAFTTYYGKPTFQAYGRGTSNPNLLSHNVMPHKGDNHPKSVQSYYSALIKGKKTSANNIIYIPRKPIQEKPANIPQTIEQIVNIPLSKPDLINHVRFSSINANQSKERRAPSGKISSIKKKIVAKSARKQKSKKISSKPKQKIVEQDGLKYMNHRQNLLKIIEDKRLNASRLAYKVTQCYPCEWQNQQKMKQSTKLWQNTKIAGLASKKCDYVGDLLRNNQEKQK